MEVNNKNIANDPWLINVIEQTHENCLAAVKADGMTLRLIKAEHQTEAICIEAVKNHGYALQFVARQSIEIIKHAVESNGFAAKFINPALLNKALLDELVYINRYVVNMLDVDEDQWFMAIIKNNNLIHSLPQKYNNNAFMTRVIEAYPMLIKDIDQTPELCRLAIKLDPGL